ncbi:hypothetical protein HGRIS_003548 [Hohenbuehelia grisea]|uniref:Deacetylase sirtuin-type domain-containing protein n=1 Tax=Hohenbuehelia grisea TaxID=104357 RepID=A0ABR3JFS2_9AGAR
MTQYIPLDAAAQSPTLPAKFLVPSEDPASQLAKVIKAVMKAKRVVVICGAGISVRAGIPDFRSPDGLFQSLKRDNPRESLSSGKDLFDASVFSSEHTTSLFFQMIAQLSQLSKAAEPTMFHQLLKHLDDRGKLLRVYTQNIDAIEAKAGLSFGVPGFPNKSRSKSKLATPAADSTSDPNHASTSRLPSPSAETPRCIPLHGTLQKLHCQACTHSCPLDEFVSSLASGVPPHCPECIAMERTRQLVGKRARGIGKMRPSVVLYNEAHKDGEGVGDAVGKDLMGSSKGKGRSGADLLLVVGTSLRVPGTKRMVREFAKAARARAAPPSKDGSSTPVGPSTPAPSPRRSPTVDEDPPITSIYLNLDFPVPTREWEGVFDAWIQGDAQTFAALLHEEIKKESDAKELAIERKRRREQEAAAQALQQLQMGTDTEDEISAQTPEPKRGRVIKRKRPAAPKATQSSKRRIIAFQAPKPPSPDRETPITAYFAPSSSDDSDARPPRSSSGIILRIPPRLRQIPEVCIPLPPAPGCAKKQQRSMPQAPLTPPRSPPRRKNPSTRKDILPSSGLTEPPLFIQNKRTSLLASRPTPTLLRVQPPEPHELLAPAILA